MKRPTAAPPTAVKIVDMPVAVVTVLPALSVPVEKRVSVEMGVEEPPLPPAPALAGPKTVVSLIAVVSVLPALLVSIEKTVAVVIGAKEAVLEPPEPDAPPAPAALVGLAAAAVVAGRLVVPALDAAAATNSSQYTAGSFIPQSLRHLPPAHCELT